ncbi:uncharacterized protein LOC131950585 [Physella acuta]|uniref:uncharacterized protein LOC131950585 n=1 Tax=Physella acuta TaxID=109671 RepID=UPI0027DE26B3|nr:uncharacterized protein LOC131950585 [Physella acuta]
MLEVIKALSALTVLIKVKYTSRKRPKSVQNFSGQYPCYNLRGRSDVLRVGTGMVVWVQKYTESDNKGTCPCVKCQHSDTPSKVWGVVNVQTARHVVFDASEVRQSRCVVGYDDNKSPGVSLDGWDVMFHNINIEGDWYNFKCVSCDLELIEKLDTTRRHFQDLFLKVRDKYRRFALLGKLTVIVSHPHGCPKQVSVGQWTRKTVREAEYVKYNKYTYTTCTCPGSSGAVVFRPGYVGYSYHPHSGSNPEENYSAEAQF